MKYSDEMMAAHHRTIKNYERFIDFAKDKKNTLQKVQSKMRLFHAERCNYCHAVDGGLGAILTDALCKPCVLYEYLEESGSPCLMGSLRSSYRATRWTVPSFMTRKQIVEAFEQRLDALALQAEFNLGVE